MRAIKRIFLMNGLSLRSKLFFLTSIVFIGFLVSSGMAFYLIKEVRIGSSTYTKIKNNSNSLERLALLKSDINQVNSRVALILSESDSDRISKMKGELYFNNNEISDKFSEIAAFLNAEEPKKGITAAMIKWQDYSEKLQNEFLPFVARGEKHKAYLVATGALKEKYQEAVAALDSTADIIKASDHTLESNTNAMVRSRYSVSIVLTVSIFVFIFLSMLFITRSITMQVLRGVEFAQSVANGDLSEHIEVRNRDELGRLGTALNSMVSGLSGMVRKINITTETITRISGNIFKVSKGVSEASLVQTRSIEQTSSAIAEINASVSNVATQVDILSESAAESSSSILEMTASIEEVAMNAEYLANSVDEVSSSIVEMTASIKQINDSVQSLTSISTTTASAITQMDTAIRQVEQNAMMTASISEGVRRDAEAGKKTVDATIMGMAEIKKSSRMATDVIKALSDRVDDIGKILSVINEVSEQSNLLALNAAIIAAQAGPQGKGFAVVADEIRELAERTKNSTREIEGLICNVEKETKKAVEAIEEAEGRVIEGEKLSKQSGEALQQIVTSVDNASQQVQEIARATEEQARGSKAIREASENMSEMVSQIAVATKEQSSGSTLIMAAVEKMKSNTIQVKNSTREQSKTSSLIATLTEQITDMIARIRTACLEQAEESGRIVNAVQDIQESNVINIEAVKAMDHAVSVLAEQVKALQAEMQAFKISEENCLIGAIEEGVQNPLPLIFKQAEVSPAA